MRTDKEKLWIFIYLYEHKKEKVNFIEKLKEMCGNKYEICWVLVSGCTRNNMDNSLILWGTRLKKTPYNLCRDDGIILETPEEYKYAKAEIWDVLLKTKYSKIKKTRNVSKEKKIFVDFEGASRFSMKVYENVEFVSLESLQW